MSSIIPNNTNVVETVNSATTVNTSSVKIIGDNFNNLTKEIVKIINSVKSIDQKEIKSSLSTIKNINTYITDYVKMIGDLFDQLSKANLLGSVDSVKNMLGYIDAKFEKVTEDGVVVNKKVSGEKFLLVDGLVSFCGVFEKIIKIIESITGNKANNSLLLSKIRVKSFIKSSGIFMQEMIDSLTKMISDVDVSKIDLLMGNETHVIDTINNYKQNKDGKATLDKAEIKDVTTKKHGLLDIIEKYTSLAGIINGMQFPNIAKTIIQSKLFTKQVEIIFNSMSELAEKFGKDEQKESYKRLSESFDSISEVFMSMDSITTFLANIAKKIWIRKNQINKSFLVLWNRKWRSDSESNENQPGLIQVIIDMVNSQQFNSITGSGENSMDSKVANAKKVFVSLSEMINIIASLGNPKLYILLIMSKITVKLFIWSLKFINDLVDSIIAFANKVSQHEKALKNSYEIISTIDDIVTSIKKIATSLLITGLIAMPAIFATLAVTVFVLSLTLFIYVVSRVLLLIEKLNITETSKRINDIAQVVLLFALTALSLIVMQFAFSKIIWKQILWQLLLLAGVVILIAAVTWVICKMFKAMNSILLIKTLINMNLVVLTFVVISYSLFAMQFAFDKIIWASLFGNLFKLLGFVAIISAVCILIGLSTVIFGAAIIGAVVMSLTIMSLVVVVVGLLFLQKSANGLDREKLVGKEGDEESMKASIFGTIMSIMEGIGDIAWKTDFLNPATLIWITLKFMIMAITILSIVVIAGLLKLLGSEKLFGEDLDTFKTNVTNNIETIFGTVQSIMDLLNTRDNNGNKDESERGLLTNIISMVSPGAANLLEAILSFAFVLTTLMTVGMIFFIAKLLDKIGTLTFNDPKANIEKIITAAKSISNVILSPTNGAPVDKNASKWDKFKNWFGNTGVGKLVNGAVEIMSNIGSTGVLATILPSILMLNSVVDLIESINKLTIPKDINTKVSSIIDAAKIISDQVRTDGDVQTIDEDKVKAFGKYVDDSVKYFEQINKLDVSKIKSLNEMYDKMGQFMDKLQDAPISEIADALVNKISPALSDINNNLDKQTNTTQHTQQQIVQQTPQAIQQTQPVDYTSILENIEELLSNIKQKLNNNPQMTF